MRWLFQSRAEPAPFILGFMLGPMMEEYFRRAMNLAKGDPTVFVTRPISAILLLLAGVLMLVLILPSVRTQRHRVPRIAAGLALK
jgi:TctA family transporter